MWKTDWDKSGNEEIWKKKMMVVWSRVMVTEMEIHE